MNESDHLALVDGEDRGDRLHLEALRDAGVRVDVDLRQHDLPVVAVDRGLDDRAERLARPAPLGPQVDHDRDVVGPNEDIGLERGIGDVDHGVQSMDGRLRPTGRPIGQEVGVAEQGRIEGIDDAGVTAWFAEHAPSSQPPVVVFAGRGRALEPHLRRDRHRRGQVGAAAPAPGPDPRHRPRHGPRAHHHLGPRPHGGPGAADHRPVHRRVGQRRAVLRHGLRRRNGRPRPGRGRGPDRAAAPTGVGVDRRRAGHDPQRRRRRGRPRRARTQGRLHRTPAHALVSPVQRLEGTCARRRLPRRRRGVRRSSSLASRPSTAPRSCTATTASTTA